LTHPCLEEWLSVFKRASLAGLSAVKVIKKSLAKTFPIKQTGMSGVRSWGTNNKQRKRNEKEGINQIPIWFGHLEPLG